MEFIFFLLATILKIVSMILSLIMIKKTGRTVVWITIALAIFIKTTANLFSFNEFIIIHSNRWSGISTEVLHLVISALLLLSIFWLASLFKSLDNSNKRLTKSNRHLDSILSGMYDPLMEIDRDYRIISINPKFQDYYEKNGYSVLGQFCYQVTHGKESPCRDLEHPCPFAKVFTDGESVITEHIHTDMNGENIIVELSCFPLFDTAGNVTSMIEIAHDVTQRRDVEEKLSIFTKAIEQSPSVVVITDLDGIIEYVNPKFTELTGYTKEEAFGCNPRILKSGEITEESYKLLWETIAEGGDWNGEFHNKKKNGDFYWESASITSIKDNSGSIRHYLAVKKDITEEKEARIALDKSEARLFDAQKAAHIGSWEIDVQNKSYFWSDENYSILGLDPTKIKPAYELFSNSIHPDDRELVHKSYWDSVASKSKHLCSHRLLLADGSLKNVMQSARHFYNKEGEHIYSTGLMQDITEMALARNEVEKSLKEKEVLLRELYHRTKNNMQVISSLLRLRSNEIDNPVVTQVFSEMDNRIQSMALVHEKLYQSKNLSNINLKEYFADLINYTKEAYNTKNSRITFTLDLESVSVLIDTATPLGLIFNEIVSNIMKHAFPGKGEGEVLVSLNKTDNGEIILKISDNGIGFPDNYNYRESTSLGIQTIFALGEGQLKGKVTMESSYGVIFTVIFKDNVYISRV